MNGAFALRTLGWMVRDTFRQSVSTKLFWVMLAFTGVCTVFCLSVDVTAGNAPPDREVDATGFITPQEARRLGEEKIKQDGVTVVGGQVSIGFGMMSFPIPRYKDDAVRHIQLWLAAILADTAGVLLALLWTAGFLPTFLEPQSATVLLAKPAPRWAILFGKYFGVVCFVALQATLFVAATWIALGVKTNVWNAVYWLAVPLLTVNFAAFYAVSAYIAVVTRSTVACVFGTLLVWLVCWTINFLHIKQVARPAEAVAPAANKLLETGYWVLPKPLDLGGVFYDALNADGYSAAVPELKAAKERGQFQPEWSVVTSLLFAAVVLGLAGYEFKQTDY